MSTDKPTPSPAGVALHARLQAYIGRGGDRQMKARDPVTAEAIKMVANAVGDRNPVYTDADYAAKSVHGGIVAPPSSVIWWHRAMFEPVDSSDWIDEQGTPHFRLEPNPARQVGLRETENGLLAEVVQLMADAGYTSLAVTGSDTTVNRYPRMGDLLCCQGPTIESIVGPKKTSLGEGFFSTSSYKLVDAKGEQVAAWTTTRIHFAPA